MKSDSSIQRLTNDNVINSNDLYSKFGKFILFTYQFIIKMLRLELILGLILRKYVQRVIIYKERNMFDHRFVYLISERFDWMQIIKLPTKSDKIFMLIRE